MQSLISKQKIFLEIFKQDTFYISAIVAPKCKTSCINDVGKTGMRQVVYSSAIDWFSRAPGRLLICPWIDNPLPGQLNQAMLQIYS